MRTARASSLALLLAGVVALAAAAPASATFQRKDGGEPVATNTSTNSHFFDFNTQGDNNRYCVTVRMNGTGTFENRGCFPGGSSTVNGTGTISQTENNLPDGVFVSVHISEYISNGTIIYPCSGDHCSSGTVIDLNKPQLTTYVAGTATYTNNPVIPIHIDYYDALSHPWNAGGNNAAVFLCQRRDRACTNSDLHNYVAACSQVNGSRFSAPGNPKTNSFDCTADYSSEPDGLVVNCAAAADNTVPDPDPTANESLGMFPTHTNQFIDPATGQGWTANKANISDTSCGSVILDRAPPDVTANASSTNPAAGDLVTFSGGATDGLSGVSGNFTWDFGDNTQPRTGANVSHTYTQPGTYKVTVTTNDGAGNQGTAELTITVKKPSQGNTNTGDDGTVDTKPPTMVTIINNSGGGGIQMVKVGGLEVLAPKKHKLNKNRKKKNKPVLMALTPDSPGAIQIALLKGSKIVAMGAGDLPRAGTFGFKLNLPKGLKPGTYRLKVTYVPDGSPTGTTKTFKIKFVMPRKMKKMKRTVVSSRNGPAKVAGAPVYSGSP